MLKSLYKSLTEAISSGAAHSTARDHSAWGGSSTRETPVEYGDLPGATALPGADDKAWAGPGGTVATPRGTKSSPKDCLGQSMQPWQEGTQKGPSSKEDHSTGQVRDMEHTQPSTQALLCDHLSAAKQGAVCAEVHSEGGKAPSPLV